MSNFKEIVLILFFFLQINALVNSQNYVGEIEKILYPVNVDTITYERECRTGKISIVGRDFYPSENKIDSLIFLIIEKNDTNDFKSLQNLLAKAESTFLSEWEPDWCGYSYRYESFYHPLTAMELALQSMHLTQNIEGTQEQYAYLKNIILCSVKCPICSISSIRLFSPYINSKKRVCWGYFCGFRLLDIHWTELKSEIVRDICELSDVQNLDDKYRAYYNSLLLKSRGIENSSFDSCFITKWDLLDSINLNPAAKFNYALVYSILTRENVSAYNFLVEKINFEDEAESKEYLSFITWNPVMVGMVKEKLAFLIRLSESVDKKNQYLKYYVDLMTESTMKDDLKIIKPYLSKESYSIIKAQFTK